MVNVNVRIPVLLFLLMTMSLVGCAAQIDERDEGTGAPSEALASAEPAEPAADDAEVNPGSAGPTAVDNGNNLLACWPRIEATNWYCCGRFRECKRVYICEYCTNSKSCYQQGGVRERSSPGCY
jgi:hypothetical protein